MNQDTYMFTDLRLFICFAVVFFLFNVFTLRVLLPSPFLVITSNRQSCEWTANGVVPLLFPPPLAIFVDEILV